ncbi:hypothetical protein [Hyphomicrobium sp.]|uniref:hypothetical protein n=1 Tax=Hyphomicrobium sp. TaxID=82 RepID=UPI000FBA59E2|nr:hypothetical protein [Hyphomicrobium sp.]RUP11160.1 MAG: electron transfer flavoprotein subunit beta/FixA family protein [Hyphomicrobium sp.]
MRDTFTVAALISAGRHPVSGTPRACHVDAVAMALGRWIAGDALRVVHAGAAEEPSLQDYLALGAGTIEVLPIGAGNDPVPELATYLRDVDIIITGNNAERGRGSGLLPYALAEALKRPVVSNALDVRLAGSAEAGWNAEIRQFLPKGQRRRIACPLPLVISVHPRAQVELKYAYARRVSGRIEIVASQTTAAPVIAPEWTMETASRRPVRLKAQDGKSAHARMQSAIVSEAKGGVVAFEGTTVDKAQVMLNYLREHRLVDF